MKKISILSGIVAIIALAASCETKVEIQDNPVAPQGEKVTITADLSAALTKVTFTPGTDGSSKPILELTWKSGDKLRVADHADNSSYSDFDLDGASVGQKQGIFTGTPVSASSYDVWVVNEAIDFADQAQSADADPSGLQYNASIEDITDLSNIAFTDVSSVLMFTAKNLPAGVAATIKSMDIKAFNSDGTACNIFDGGNSLTVTLTAAGDEGTDNNLVFYATLPKGSTAIPAGTSMLVKLNAPGEAHDVYTRYFTITSAVTLTAGKLNEIAVGCANVASHAGAATCDGSTSAKAYLIGDKYQMDAIHDLLVADETLRYFKMIDDINMSGITWVPFNNVADGSSHFSKYMYFDGNGHTLSYISTDPSTIPAYPSVFGVLNGTVTNLTIDHATITPGPNSSGGKSAILAGYIGSSDSKVTPAVNNVAITNSTVGTSGAKGGNYCGILAANMSKAGGALSNISISDCEVASTNYSGGMVSVIEAATTISGTNTVANTDVYGSLAGGVVGFANALVTMSGCTYTGGTVTSSARYCGGMLGSIANQDSNISNCHVNEAIISSSADRVGGFVGQQQAKPTINNCSVTGGSITGGTLNIGGFAGVAYGSIVDCHVYGNPSVRSSNETKNVEVNLGGFVGYLTGSISNSSSVTTINQNGYPVGGFAGIILSSGSIESSTASGSFTASGASVKAGNYSVANGGYAGGFVGYCYQGSLTKCSSSINCAISDPYAGGLIGVMRQGTISQCMASGNMTGNTNNQGGLIGWISGAATIQDCYATGNNTSTNQRQGGLIGLVESASDVLITRCYASGNITSSSFSSGGLISRISSTTCTVTNCAAWNSTVYCKSHSYNTNWSTGAIVGVAHPNCVLTDNYRNPSMTLTAWWVPAADYNHPNVNGTTTPLVTMNEAQDSASESAATSLGAPYQFPYHGKVDAGKTLSQLASTTLGWSSEIWDFSGALPVLK